MAIRNQSGKAGKFDEKLLTLRIMPLRISLKISVRKYFSVKTQLSIATKKKSSAGIIMFFRFAFGDAQAKY